MPSSTCTTVLNVKHKPCQSCQPEFLPDSRFVSISGEGLTHMSGANLLQLLLQLKQMRQLAYTDWPGAFEKQGCGSRGYDRRQPDF